MHIGIEAQRIFKKEKHGIEYTAIELITHLQENDKHNQYTIFVKDGPDNKIIKQTKNFEIKVLKNAPYPLWEQLILTKAIKNSNIDVLHCTANTGPLFSRIPIVLTLHDIFFIERIHFEGTTYQNFGNIYRNLIVRQLIKKAVAIVTVSRVQQINIKKKFPGVASKVSVIHNGLSSAFSRFNIGIESSDTLRKYNLPDRYNLFLGNEDPRKNSSTVINSYIQYIKKHPGAIPLVCPGLPPKYINRHLNKLGAKKFNNYFLCPGYIDYLDFPNVMSASVSLLIPSKKEGFGLPILEAMASEIPVITSNASAMKEIAGNAALFVNPEDPESIVTALIAITTESKLRSELINKGKARCLQFSWQKAAMDYLKIYKKFSPSE